jgi:single-strand DNA-binding protein
MSVNKAIIVGNLGRDPEVRALPSRQNVANLSVATKARFADRNGERQERTEWHRVVAFGELADNCQRLLLKGRKVYVEGRLQTRQYQAKDGSGLRYRTEIVALQLRMLGTGSNGAAPTTSRSLGLCSCCLRLDPSASPAPVGCNRIFSRKSGTQRSKSMRSGSATFPQTFASPGPRLCSTILES